LAPELPKEPGGGAGGIVEGAEEIPGRPVFSVGAREKLKILDGSLSSEGGKRSSPGREINTDQNFEITVIR
jgi:hypothetical protein